MAQRLNEAFRSSPSMFRVGTGSHPIWYGLALTEILLLVDDGEVEYATARLDEAKNSARLTALTANLVVDVLVTGIQGDAGDRDVRAVPRGNLVAIGITAGETPFSQSAFSDWPGEVAITAHYKGLSTPAEFPLERVPGAGRTEMELLAGLRKDLTASR